MTTFEVAEVSSLSTPRTDIASEGDVAEEIDCNVESPNNSSLAQQQLQHKEEVEDEELHQFHTIALDDEDDKNKSDIVTTTTAKASTTKSLEELKNQGISFETILKSSDAKLFSKVEIIKAYSDVPKQLFESGLFDDYDFRKASVDIKIFKDVRAARNRNIPMKTLSPLYKPRKLLAVGYTYRELKELGFSVIDLRNDNVDVTKESALLLKAGYTKADLNAKTTFK